MAMVKDSFFSLLSQIRSICGKCHRDYSEITLVAVTKTQDIETIKEAISGGITQIGENYIQEANRKFAQLKANAIKWHFIGNLQKNKAKYAVKIFDLVHSVDSLDLAISLDKEARKINKFQDILIQVNVAKESTKSGVYAENLFELVKYISELKNLRLKGLMTIAPFVDSPEKSRPVFRRLKELIQELNNSGILSYKLNVLSMGMSLDYHIAIEEGATMLRIGRLIFGERK